MPTAGTLGTKEGGRTFFLVLQERIFFFDFFLHICFDKFWKVRFIAATPIASSPALGNGNTYFKKVL